MRRTARTSNSTRRARSANGRPGTRPAAVRRFGGAARHPREATLRPAASLLLSASLLLAASLVLDACGDRTPIPLDGSLPEAPAAAELEGALLASAEAWNREELDGFMAPYLRSPGLTFSGSGGVRRGFDAVMRRYRENFFETGEPLPTLRFEDLETLDLGRDHALMLGRYVLLAADPGNRVDTGYVSLVWVRTVDGWRIMHDHTTATEN